MPAVLDGATTAPHLHLITHASWSPYSAHCYPAPTSSPTPMTPESITSYMPHLHDSPVPHGSPDSAAVPTSTWFASSVPASNASNEASYASYGYPQSMITPHAPSGPYSPHQQHVQAPELASGSAATTSIEHPAGNFSPVSQCSRASELPQQQEFARQSEGPCPDVPLAHIPLGSTVDRPRSSPAEYAGWPLNPLGISTPSMHPHFYPNATFSSTRDRSPCLSESGLDLPSDLAAPQPRRLYTPIAPHPSSQRTSAPKRSREDDTEFTDATKRRKRSVSSVTATMELGDEDRLLIQLKDEESMPWKDIAARFQSDLGKTYQIPALQMRLKRLRERMRVWTDVDVKALRMAHDYWVQSKFEIIAQKMLEFGAAEKWTARQCARKWAEIDPGPTPYTTYDHHIPSYAPYTMSPIDQSHFMPYVHM